MYLQYHVHKHTCTVHVMSTVGSLNTMVVTVMDAVLRAYIHVQVLGALYILMHTYILTHTYRRLGNLCREKKFRRSPSTTKIKPAKYFLQRINGVSLYCRVVIATKIKPGKNLTAEILYRQKIPDLRYILMHTYTCTY